MMLPKNFTADYVAHTAQIGVLTQEVQALATIASKIPVETHPSLSYTIQRIQVRHFLRAIDELNATICYALSEKYSAPAEALSRISMEMSVNLLFILADAPHARSKGLLNKCIKERKSRAKKWIEFSTAAGLGSSKKAAEELLQTTEFFESGFISSKNTPTATWPNNIKNKFKAVGLEESYYTHFNSSSDSVHLLGEDILNHTLAEFSPIEVRGQLFTGLAAEKLSFAIYLLIQAILFHCEAILTLLEAIGELKEMTEEVERIAEIVNKFNIEHEGDLKRNLSLGESR